MSQEEQKAVEKEDYAGLDIETGNRKRKRESLSQELSTRTAEEGSMSAGAPEERERLCQEQSTNRAEGGRTGGKGTSSQKEKGTNKG